MLRPCANGVVRHCKMAVPHPFEALVEALKLCNGHSLIRQVRPQQNSCPPLGISMMDPPLTRASSSSLPPTLARTSQPPNRTDDPGSSRIDDPSLGLAGAEERLFNLQLDIGQLAVARRTVQLRVDYLTQLNTPAMLVASANVALIATLQYSFLSPKVAGTAEEHTNLFRELGVAIYTIACSISLGASLWVLYTSNNLITLATRTTLQAQDLKGVQGAEIVLSVRMSDVRKWYIAAITFMTIGLYAMVCTLMEFYIAIPSVISVVAVLAHAIHSDHETAHHFEQVTGVVLDGRFEYGLDRFILPTFRCLRRLCCCGPIDDLGYSHLGERIEALFEERYDQKLKQTMPMHQKAGLSTSIPRHPPLQSATRSDPVLSALLLKTPSSSGPISVLNAVAFERDPAVRRHLLSATAANTPTNQSWWVLQGAALLCYRTHDEWRTHVHPRLHVDLHQYIVLKTYDHQRRLTIALLPKLVLRHDAPRDSSHRIDQEMTGKSWYLSVPPGSSGSLEVQTSGWFDLLYAACDDRGNGSANGFDLAPACSDRTSEKSVSWRDSRREAQQ